MEEFSQISSWTLAEGRPETPKGTRKSPHNRVRQKKGKKEKIGRDHQPRQVAEGEKKSLHLEKPLCRETSWSRTGAPGGQRGTQQLVCGGQGKGRTTRGVSAAVLQAPGWVVCLLAQRGTEPWDVGFGEQTQGEDCCPLWRGNLTGRQEEAPQPGKFSEEAQDALEARCHRRRVRLTTAMPSLPAAPCLHRHREKPRSEQAHPHLSPRPPQSTQPPGSWEGFAPERVHRSLLQLPVRRCHCGHFTQTPAVAALFLPAWASKCAPISCCFHSFSPGQGTDTQGGPHAELDPKSKLRPKGCVTKEEEWRSFLQTHNPQMPEVQKP